MTSPEEHRKIVQQFLDDINEKVRAGLLLERQKLVGFAVSETSTNLLEYFLHKKQAISPGFRVNHNYFASEKKAERMLDFEFPLKFEIISLMVKIEESRDLLCYGKQKSLSLVEEDIVLLQKLRKLLSQEVGEEL